jgi:hypothetical protein
MMEEQVGGIQGALQEACDKVQENRAEDNREAPGESRDSRPKTTRDESKSE